MEVTTALVAVIFGLLVLNGAVLVVGFLVFKSLLERVDMYIQQRTIEDSTDPVVKPKKIFVRAGKASATPTLVGSKPTEESEAADLVTHQDADEDGRYKDLDTVDRELLNQAYDTYKGFNPPAEVEETETVEAS